MNAGWAVQNYRASHFEGACQVLSRAFFDDPSSIYISPQPGRRKKHLSWLFGMILRYGLQYGEVHTTGEEYFGLVDGVAIWLPSERAVIPLMTQIRLGMWGAPFRLGPGPLKRVFNYSDYLDRLRKRYAKHKFLWMLAVDPSLQGKGRGRALLKAGLKRADSFQEHCYLETHQERNLRFYREHGFTAVSEGDVPDGGPHVWCLERNPNPESEIGLEQAGTHR